MKRPGTSVAGEKIRCLKEFTGRLSAHFCFSILQLTGLTKDNNAVTKIPYDATQTIGYKAWECVDLTWLGFIVFMFVYLTLQ